MDFRMIDSSTCEGSDGSKAGQISTAGDSAAQKKTGKK